MTPSERLISSLRSSAEGLANLSEALSDFVPGVAGALLNLAKEQQWAIDRFEKSMGSRSEAIAAVNALLARSEVEQ